MTWFTEIEARMKAALNSLLGKTMTEGDPEDAALDLLKRLETTLTSLLAQIK